MVMLLWDHMIQKKEDGATNQMSAMEYGKGITIIILRLHMHLMDLAALVLVLLMSLHKLVVQFQEFFFRLNV